jgi:hypothetical protein
MLPSAYITDKTRTLNEKLVHNAQQSHQVSITSLFPHVTSRLPLDSPIFAPNPPNIVIQNFTPFKEYEIQVAFKNMDSVPRKLRLVHLDHPCFSLVVCLFFLTHFRAKRANLCLRIASLLEWMQYSH